MHNNLLHQLLAKQYGTPAERFPANRVNGLSTAIALKALGEAMQNPRRRYYIYDHANTISTKANLHTVWLAEGIVRKLNMVGFTFKGDNLGYYVVYDLSVSK